MAKPERSFKTVEASCGCTFTVNHSKGEQRFTCDVHGYEYVIGVLPPVIDYSIRRLK